MSRTYCEAEMKFIDVSALNDSSIYTEYNQSFANQALFKEEDVTTAADYATLELNHFFLDGSRTLMPSSINDIAFCSNKKTTSDCSFEVNPVLRANFTENHTSSGLTLYFCEDYPEEIKVKWFDESGAKIIEKTFHPDRLRYVCKQQVEDYRQVDIEFVKTRLPEHYVKLQYILYGRHIIWSGDEIKEASITEEADVTSATISINTASLKVIDPDDQFDIASEDGEWKSIQKNQPVNIYEYRDDKKVTLGSYFVNTFDFSRNVTSFELIDSVGLLDQYIFRDGKIYQDESVSNIVASIFAGTGIKYKIDNSLKDLTLSGHLGIMTCREALQQVAFSINAVVDDSRGDTIEINKPSRGISHSIGPDRKFNGQTNVKLGEYVSGVSVEFSKYDLASEAQEIYNDTLQEGQQRIEFSGPFLASSVTVSAGSIVKVATNYVIVNMTAEGSCVISGKPYEETKFILTKVADSLAAGESENIKEFSNCTLYNAEVAKNTLNELFDYYQLRKILTIKYLCDEERAGKWANILDIDSRNNATLLEKQTINLTGGYIAQTTCRGYSFITTDYQYAGAGLYGEDNRLI